MPAGTYLIQVQTNAAGDNPLGDGHNRFSMRAFGSSGSDKDNIAISGITDMAIYADLPSAHTSFFLTQVPPRRGRPDPGRPAVRHRRLGRHRHGDDHPADGLRAVRRSPAVPAPGPKAGSLTNCSIPANSSYNGKWETISVPIPSATTATCHTPTGCWVTLTYDYGSGNQPQDTTSWQASIEGTPVRLNR